MPKYITCTLFVIAMLHSASASPPSSVHPESTKVQARLPNQVESEFSPEVNIYELTKETVRIQVKPKPRRQEGEAQRPHTLTRPVVGQKFPYVVPFPEGYDPNGKYAVPVARQYESDGTHTDLYEGGHLQLYDADGDFIGRSGGCGTECRRRQGRGPDPKVALANWYVMKYRDRAMISLTSDTANEYRLGDPDGND